MKKIGLVLSFVLALSGWINAQTINSQKSIVNFEIGNMKVKTVEGTFGGMKGDLVFDVSDLVNSHFKVCIDAATVNTDNEKRDDHLRNEDFFYVEKHPEICFTSISISKTGDAYITKGELEMHGVTKIVEIPFTFDDNKFTGRLSVNRFDYKIGEGTNTMMVSEEVSLEIICVVE